MIIVKGTIPVKSSYRDVAVSLVNALAEASRQEAGCLAYEVYLQADAPEVIMIWQQWSSEDALEAHFESDHVDDFLDAIPDYIDGQVTSARYEVMAEESAEREDLLELPLVSYADNIKFH